MKKKMYLAGAIGCYKDNSEKATQWRKNICRILYERGCESEWEAFDPTKYYNYWNPIHKTEKEIMRFEFNRIKQCDVVLVNLKDINISIGTSDELLFSYLNGIPIVGFCEESDYIDLIHTWKIEQIDRIESGKDALQNALDYILNYYS